MVKEKRRKGRREENERTMSKGVYETRILPNLDKIAEMAKEGVSQKDIASKLHVACSTFKKYLDLGRKGDERYTDFSAAFACACEVADEKVENALYKRCCGYDATERRREQKLDRNGNIIWLETETTRHIPPDPTSIMFFLTNRRRDKWKYKPDGEMEDDGKGTGVVLMPEVK